MDSSINEQTPLTEYCGSQSDWGSLVPSNLDSPQACPASHDPDAIEGHWPGCSSLWVCLMIRLSSWTLGKTATELSCGLFGALYWGAHGMTGHGTSDTWVRCSLSGFSTAVLLLSPFFIPVRSQSWSPIHTQGEKHALFSFSCIESLKQTGGKESF